MSSFARELTDRFTAVAGIDPEIRPATKPEFGHFQTNVALRLAKSEGRPPREVAQRIADTVDLTGLAEPLEIAGPGFINVRLTAQALAERATTLLADPHNGLAPASAAQTVVIDYSAPNVAKQMHVGHLRSTIIGDCLARVLRAAGHTVVAQNHIGDWGRQFGMLVEQIFDEGIDPTTLDLGSAEALYLRANARLKESEEFAGRARDRVVLLQSGDQATRTIWQQLIDMSLVGFNAAYARLGVLLTDEDLAGESIYNDQLPAVAAELEERGLAVVDDGALCLFVDGYKAPLIIRNSRGGYGYDTTDLAAVKYRVQQLGVDRIIYVVGSPQTQHFDQVFAGARKAGWLPDTVSAEHVAFGQVLGPDGKKISTREGTGITLTTLLDAAEQQAAPAIAMAAVKYADLSSGLGKDYTFDIDRMVQTTGNTGPYLQYAHARLCQVLRKAEAERIEIGAKVLELTEPAEQTLALQLSRFGEAVEDVARTLQPHRLCTYLYDLAVAVARFYDDCPVLRSEGLVRESRLALCLASRRVLATGLSLLGIEAPDRM